jgi:tetratricopeptide (TPR) repeat protein
MRRAWCGAVVITLSAGMAFADWNAGLAAYNRKDYDAALREFQAVSKRMPAYPGAHFMVGMTFKKLGRDAEALEPFVEAARLDAGNPQYALYAADALLGAGRASEARELLGAVALDRLTGRQKSALLTVNGKVALALDDTTGAIDAFRRATQADPDSAGPYELLGIALARNQEDREAFDAYRRAWEIGKDFRIGRNAVASGVQAARRTTGSEDKHDLYARVAAVATRLAETTGDAADALLAGEAFLGAQRFDDALAWFRKSGRNDVLVMLYSAQCHLGKGDARTAESELRRALGQGPDAALRAQIYASLGYALDVQRRYDEAARVYQQAGDAGRAAEMRDKQRKAEQNAAADAEQKKADEIKDLIQKWNDLTRSAPPTPVPTPNG